MEIYVCVGILRKRAILTKINKEREAAMLRMSAPKYYEHWHVPIHMCLAVFALVV